MPKFYAAFQVTKNCFKLSKVIEIFNLQVTYLKSTSEMLLSVSFRSSTIKKCVDIYYSMFLDDDFRKNLRSELVS